MITAWLNIACVAVLAMSTAVMAQVNPYRLPGAFACDQDEDMRLCVSAEVRTPDIVTIRVVTVAQGWVAFGPGSSMSNADVTVLWIADGVAYCSDRKSTSYATPTVDPQQDCAVQQSESNINADGVVTITYQRPIDTGDMDDLTLLARPQSFVWAFSREPPVDPTDLATDLASHAPEDRGVLTVNLLGGNGTVGGEGVIVSQAFVLHGVAMMSAWLFFGPLGIYVARYMKHKLGVWWYRLHVFLMVFGTFGCTVFGAVMAFLNTSIHLNGIHQYLGLAVMVGMLLQMALGQYINMTFDPARTDIPGRDKLHWWLGRLLVLGAVAACILGILERKTGDIRIWIIALVGVFFVFIILFALTEFFIGKSHHGPDGDMKDVDPGHVDGMHDVSKSNSFQPAHGNPRGAAGWQAGDGDDASVIRPGTSYYGYSEPESKYLDTNDDHIQPRPISAYTDFTDDGKSFYDGPSAYGHATGFDDSESKYEPSQYGPSDYGHSVYTTSLYGPSEYGVSQYEPETDYGKSPYGKSYYNGDSDNETQYAKYNY